MGAGFAGGPLTARGRLARFCAANSLRKKKITEFAGFAAILAS
jgi:hypothetical protein